jgi:hypothetical protein
VVGQSKSGAWFRGGREVVVLAMIFPGLVPLRVGCLDAQRPVLEVVEAFGL